MRRFIPKLFRPLLHLNLNLRHAAATVRNQGGRPGLKKPFICCKSNLSLRGESARSSAQTLTTQSPTAASPLCTRRPNLAPTHFNQNSPPLHPQSLIILILLILLIAANSANAFALHTFPCCGNLWQISQLSASTLVTDWLT